jgi:hypothetical protein
VLPWAGSESPATLLAAFNRPARKADALCREHPEIDFLPTPSGVERAKEICCRWLCRNECLDYALADRTLVGVWGGTTAEERQETRRARVRSGR